MSERRRKPSSEPALEAVAAVDEGKLGMSVTAPPGTPQDNDKPTSLWQDAWHDLRRRPVFVLTSAIIVLLVTISLFPGLFAKYAPGALDDCELSNSHLPASGAHWMGTDLQGCDVYSRAMYATRVSISVGVLTAISVTVIGGIVGALAAYYGGRIDGLLSRICDVFFALPLLLGAFVILSVFPAGNVWVVVFTLSVLAWPQLARIARSAVITIRGMDYVQAARALGANDARILRRHILPNAVAPVIVVTTINLGVFITVEATLSFLGIGIKNSVSWGVMINDARNRFLDHPGPLLWPAGLLFITVLSFILLGDAVRDALDPKLR